MLKIPDTLRRNRPKNSAPQTPESGFEILKPRKTCFAIGRAARASLLVDAAEYFARLDDALRQATRSIVIIGWDFDAAIRLRHDQPESPLLGDLLRTLVEERPDLEVRILIWNLSTIHAPGATIPLILGAPWQDHPRIRLKLDSPHPVYGAHHQKIVVIDDVIAFVGGIDLTVDRWDTAEHLPEDPRRVMPSGKPYDAVHDVQMVVDGEAARYIRAEASPRWRSATGEDFPYAPVARSIWPASLEPDLRNVDVGVARTLPRRGLRRGIREIERLNRAAIAAARRLIYIEAQYFADRRIGDLLARQLSRPDGPEVVVLTARAGHGMLERWIMDGNRDRVVRRMMRADCFDRLRVLYPVIETPQGDHPIFIHSKILLIDDKFLRGGSSNFNRRSTGLDTECDLAIEATDRAGKEGIAAIRARLLAEHLGCEPDQVTRTLREKGSLRATIDRLDSGARRLRRFTHISRRGPTHLMFGTRLLDPRGPLRLMALFAPRGRQS